MQSIRERGPIAGHAPVAGILASLTAPAAVVLDSDLLMALAVLSFCASAVVAGSRAASTADSFSIHTVAASAAILIIALPAAEGVMRHALAMVFSLLCLALWSMSGRRSENRSPAVDAL